MPAAHLIPAAPATTATEPAAGPWLALSAVMTASVPPVAGRGRRSRRAGLA